MTADSCTCTDSCPEAFGAEHPCAYCGTALGVYDPCPRVGFGCGANFEAGDCDCCTDEQWNAAGGQRLAFARIEHGITP
jgi:hypothetical protein